MLRKVYLVKCLIKERRDIKLSNKREHSEAKCHQNKFSLKEKKSVYYEENKEQIRDYQAEYYEITEIL